MSGTMQLVGVNLSGGEYGPTGSGTLGTDYTYPTQQEITYEASKGMNVIRVPFQLERLEPTQGGPLDQTQVADLQQVVSEAAAAGMKVILDPHNYGQAWGNDIGSADTPDSSYATFWGDMAGAFKDDPNVIYGLMNEPHNQSPQDWATADNAAIAAIRGAGATQEILVPGTAWDGAWTWTSSGNAAAINPSTIVDPANNYAFDVHQYLDGDGSGTNYDPITDPQIGVQRLTDVTNWAEQNGAKLFLSEFGVPADAQSATAEQNMLSYMAQHSDVWQGATEWTGGPWVGSYPMSVEPQNGQDTPQMTVLEQFAPGSQQAPAPAQQPAPEQAPAPAPQPSPAPAPTPPASAPQPAPAPSAPPSGTGDSSAPSLPPQNLTQDFPVPGVGNSIASSLSPDQTLTVGTTQIDITKLVQMLMGACLHSVAA